MDGKQISALAPNFLQDRDSTSRPASGTNKLILLKPKDESYHFVLAPWLTPVAMVLPSFEYVPRSLIVLHVLYSLAFIEGSHDEETGDRAIGSGYPTRAADQMPRRLRTIVVM